MKKTDLELEISAEFMFSRTNYRHVNVHMGSHTDIEFLAPSPVRTLQHLHKKSGYLHLGF